MAKVSVIIPVYNAAPYLRKCVDSVLAQTLDDIEIILVDDGSTDGSSAICDSYLPRENITVIHQKNQGASAARNIALRIAKGEYTGFVDADDYIEKDMYASLYQLAKQEDLDIVFGNYSIVEGNVKKPNSAYMPESVVLKKKDIEQLICGKESSRILWFAVKSIFRRDLLAENRIAFREGMLGEDTVFDLEALLCSNTVCFINKSFYNYVQTPNSQIRVRFKKDLIKKLNNNYLAKKELFEKHGLDDKLTVLCDYTMAHSIPMILSNELANNNDLREKSQNYKTMRETEMICDAFNTASIRTIRSTRYRVYAYLLKAKCFWLLSVLTNQE